MTIQTTRLNSTDEPSNVPAEGYDDQVSSIQVYVLEAISRLSARRPVFHSEADFQYELARALQSLSEDFGIRLERPVRINEVGTFNVDLLVRWMNSWHGVELKYITAGLATEVNGESFLLKSQAAQDLRRYDIN